MTAELVDRVREAGFQRVKQVARQIATESPTLADLSSEQLEQVARFVVAEGLKDDLRKAADLEKIPYSEERGKYLATKSHHTRISYRAALRRLDEWCKVQGFSTPELTPARADDWIEGLKAEGKLSPGSIRLTVAAASAFWTWLERRHPNELHNPFRGTKARPKKRATRKLEVPSGGEVRLMKSAARGWLKPAIIMMAEGGLRAGALPSLSISAERYICTTKGKEQSGKLPKEARGAIKRAGLSLRSPFADKKANAIEDAVKYLAKKLHAAGQIRAQYSAHDLRHAFAKRYYEATKDIYRLSRLLGHADIATTQHYLRSLGVEELR